MGSSPTRPTNWRFKSRRPVHASGGVRVQMRVRRARLALRADHYSRTLTGEHNSFGRAGIDFKKISLAFLAGSRGLGLFSIFSELAAANAAGDFEVNDRQPPATQWMQFVFIACSRRNLHERASHTVAADGSQKF